MYKSVLNTLLILVLIGYVSKAQDIQDNQTKKNRFTGIETGINLLFCQSPEYDFIRGDVLPYSSGAVSENLKALMHKKYLGLKTEFRTKNNRWGLLVGLRYSQTILSLGKDNFYTSSSGYFYVLDNQSGTTTEYFRVSEINRKIHHIGAPIELRWLSNSPNFLKIYLKLGLELDYRLKSSEAVVFYHEAMNEYQDLILSKFSKPAPISSAIYFSTGFNLNKIPNADLELVFPYIMLSPENTGIVKSHSGIGIKLEIRIPH